MTVKAKEPIAVEHGFVSPTVESDFTICVRHKPSNTFVEWAPGRAVEMNIVDELCSRVKAKGVGALRTEAHVIADVRLAMTELLYDLKKQV